VGGLLAAFFVALAHRVEAELGRTNASVPTRAQSSLHKQKQRRRARAPALHLLRYQE
jgi:hypothetical protein